jgi:hypothetical protein
VTFYTLFVSAKCDTLEKKVEKKYIEITGFEFKLTANKNYRSTGVVTVGDRLGAGVKVDRG